MLACQMEHKLPPGRTGVIVTEIGPWEIKADHWQHSFLPGFTDECDLCATRTKAGKKPSCVQHCQAQVLSIGPVEELAMKLSAKSRQALIVPG
jgi:anaerobic dimethyl sulfoxide reductase subunit B (iron-sulfur subunit)